MGKASGLADGLSKVLKGLEPEERKLFNRAFKGKSDNVINKTLGQNTPSDFVHEIIGREKYDDKIVNSFTKNNHFSKDDVQNAVNSLKGEDWYKNRNNQDLSKHREDVLDNISRSKATKNILNGDWTKTDIYNDDPSTYIKNLKDSKLINSDRARAYEKGINENTTSDDILKDGVAKEQRRLREIYNKDLKKGNNGSNTQTNKQGKNVKDVANKKSINSYMEKKYGGEFDNIEEVFSNPYSAETLRKSSYEKNRHLNQATEDMSFDDFNNLPTEKQFEHIQTARKLRTNSPGLMDHLGYHKVPQMAAGVGTTAWLVSRLDSSKGQMDNSQLYGQQQY